MDTDRELRFQLRRALDEVAPPAPWLAAAVKRELANSRQQAGRPSVPVRLAFSLLALLLVGAVVIGFRAWASTTHPVVPAGRVSVKSYQAMISVDSKLFASANHFGCSSYNDTSCLPKVAQADASAQAWLDDLNRSRPPERFVSLDPLLRRHLALILSADQAFVTAFKAKDDTGTGAASSVATSELGAVQSLAADITASSQGTVASYVAAIAVDRATLSGCAICQLLVSSPLASCQSGQAATCATDLAAIRARVESFQGHLILLYAPNSLAAADARLQADLAVAAQALAAGESALAAHDQVALQASERSLGQALVRVDADFASIVGGK